MTNLDNLVAQDGDIGFARRATYAVVNLAARDEDVMHRDGCTLAEDGQERIAETRRTCWLSA
ncbi:MAG TPA: hypothetical protein VFS12_00790 [Terriglobia bacterium]|nr:hypothetical protein [Terriglobia bacterium]